MCALYVHMLFLGMYPSCTMCAAWHVAGLCVHVRSRLFGYVPSVLRVCAFACCHAFVCALPGHRLVDLNVYGRRTGFHVHVFGGIPPFMFVVQTYVFVESCETIVQCFSFRTHMSVNAPCLFT